VSARQCAIDMLANLTLKPFTHYITYLVEGKLDGYFSSIQPEDLVTDLNVKLPSWLMLLLHDLGMYKDEKRIQELFVYLFDIHLCLIMRLRITSRRLSQHSCTSR
jgi:hypothetical protein